LNLRISAHIQALKNLVHKTKFLTRKLLFPIALIVFFLASKLREEMLVINIHAEIHNGGPILLYFPAKGGNES